MSEANIEPTDELAQFLSDLEASEINGEITLSWMYDRLWTVRIGALGDYHAEDNFKSLGEAMNWLRDKVIELYPESEFAKQWRAQRYGPRSRQCRSASIRSRQYEGRYALRCPGAVPTPKWRLRNAPREPGRRRLREIHRQDFSLRSLESASAVAEPRRHTDRG